MAYNTNVPRCADPDALPELDPTPAIRMREELATARAAGKDFDGVWQFAILRVTRGLRGRDRKEWVEVFGEQRAVWHAAFDRDDVPDVLSLLVAA